jgi:hypothetical protein
MLVKPFEVDVVALRGPRGCVSIPHLPTLDGCRPGLTRCGPSVVESCQGRQIIAPDVDVVRTPAGEPTRRRLLAISEAVEHWLDTHHPAVPAIERVFSQNQALPVSKITSADLFIGQSSWCTGCFVVVGGNRGSGEYG